MSGFLYQSVVDLIKGYGCTASERQYIEETVANIRYTYKTEPFAVDLLALKNDALIVADCLESYLEKGVKYKTSSIAVQEALDYVYNMAKI